MKRKKQPVEVEVSGRDDFWRDLTGINLVGTAPPSMDFEEILNPSADFWDGISSEEPRPRSKVFTFYLVGYEFMVEEPVSSYTLRWKALTREQACREAAEFLAWANSGLPKTEMRPNGGQYLHHPPCSGLLSQSVWINPSWISSCIIGEEDFDPYSSWDYRNHGKLRSQETNGKAEGTGRAEGESVKRAEPKRKKVKSHR